MNLKNLIFVLIYLGSFHLWKFLAEPYIIYSGLIIFIVWCGLIRVFKKDFMNSYERFFYYLIGFDLLIESLLQPLAGYGFYLCALAFAMVIFLYHYFSKKTKCKKCFLTGKDLSE